MHVAFLAGLSIGARPLVLLRLHDGPGERTYRWEYPRRSILRFGVARGLGIVVL